jgi:hypothetical protein
MIGMRCAQRFFRNVDKRRNERRAGTRRECTNTLFPREIRVGARETMLSKRDGTHGVSRRRFSDAFNMRVV